MIPDLPRRSAGSFFYGLPVIVALGHKVSGTMAVCRNFTSPNEIDRFRLLSDETPVRQFLNRYLSDVNAHFGGHRSAPTPCRPIDICILTCTQRTRMWPSPRFSGHGFQVRSGCRRIMAAFGSSLENEMAHR